jgi:hypothetical protein
MSKLGQRRVSDDKREDADCGNNRSAANYGRSSRDLWNALRCVTAASKYHPAQTDKFARGWIGPHFSNIRLVTSLGSQEIKR